ncbi:MAG: hypothetical protein J6W03_01325 [Bacteroidaceae bacterium]|nr:hypothetical protein [Bacteroidaceae bacterium]
MKTTDYRQLTIEELEGKLLERLGKETPFTVPEGYFNDLSDKVMSRIAERKHRRNLIWRWTAAAVLVGCVAAGGMLFESHYEAQQLEAENIQYIEDALDYSMIDNMSIASYLTEAE